MKTNKRPTLLTPDAIAKILNGGGGEINVASADLLHDAVVDYLSDIQTATIVRLTVTSRQLS